MFEKNCLLLEHSIKIAIVVFGFCCCLCIISQKATFFFKNLRSTWSFSILFYFTSVFFFYALFCFVFFAFFLEHFVLVFHIHDMMWSKSLFIAGSRMELERCYSETSLQLLSNQMERAWLKIFLSRLKPLWSLLKHWNRKM